MIPAFVAAQTYIPPRQDRTGFTTPEPCYVADLPAPPHPVDFEIRQRVLAAANVARRRYDGPVGELLSAELTAWAEWGWRLGKGGFVLAATEQILGGAA